MVLEDFLSIQNKSSGWTLLSQPVANFLRRQIRNDVSELVDVQNRALQPLFIQFLDLRKSEPIIVLYLWSKICDLYTAGHPGRDRSENVSGMKGRSHRPAEVMLRLYGNDAVGRFAAADKRKNAIVRSHEIVVVCGYDDSTAARSDARVHYGQVDRLAGEVGIGAEELEGAFQDVVCSDLVGDIHDTRLWVDTEDGSFDGARIVVAAAKIAGESDEG